MRKLLLLCSIFATTMAYGHTDTCGLAMLKVNNDTLYPATANRNYVFTRTMLSEDSEEYFDEIQFYDGLGREVERTQSDGSFSFGNLYKHYLQEYDKMGRKEKQWLPATSGGAFVEPELYKNVILWPYNQGDKRLFSQTKYEESPLNRIVEQYGIGDAWADHPVHMEYLANTTDVSLRCSYYYINANDILVRQKDYLPGELNVTKITDEDARITYRFVDKEGNTVLTRQQDGGTMVDTYYVYNCMRKLCFVLPPMVNDDISSANLDLYAYHYKYDHSGRCISKKLPGCTAISYVYDKADRIILSQDGNQLQDHEWTFTFYDIHGRESLSGRCYIDTVPSLDDVIVTAKRIASGRNTGGVLDSGYTVENFPFTVFNPHKQFTLLQANYYDDYFFTPDNKKLTFNFDVPSSEKYDSLYVNEINGSISARGFLTGTKVKILGADDSSSGTLSSAFYYDDKGRIVQRRSQNLMGGYDIDYFSYTFGGLLSAKMHLYQLSTRVRHMEEYFYKYNSLGDLISIDHNLDNAHENKQFVQCTYDKARRLQLKDVGHMGGYTNYVYDIRDQVTQASSPYFTEQLYYTNGPGTPCYNGNISSVVCEVQGDTNSKGYRFSYDGMNRLSNAEYGEGKDLKMNMNRFNERVTTYDKNGNILGLQRSGQIGVDSYGVVDNLSLSYNGNQLLRVTDDAINSVFGNGFEFKDGNNIAEEYNYDYNGNLKKDSNKGIVLIKYNCLNLPTLIASIDGSTVNYLYGADRRKLRMIHTVGDSITTIDYCGNAVYENGSLKKILTEGEGYVSFSDTVPTYHYFSKDHLGNICAVYNDEREVEETNHYYPFGGMQTSLSDVQPYKYNGKELYRQSGLDLYDYGARMYDAALGRWNVVDPLAEKYYGMNPYGYCNNNPIKNIDPDGRQVIPVPLPYGPLPFYYPMTYPQTYNLPSDQQLMRHASAKFTELGQIITNTPKSSFAFGTLLYYQAKNAISPEYEHQRKRDRRNKEELDRNQANVAKSIENNITATTPSGDPLGKKDPKDWNKWAVPLIGVGAGTEIGVQLLNSDPSRDANEVRMEQLTPNQNPEQRPKQTPQEQNLIYRIINWIIN